MGCHGFLLHPSSDMQLRKCLRIKLPTLHSMGSAEMTKSQFLTSRRLQFSGELKKQKPKKPNVLSLFCDLGAPALNYREIPEKLRENYIFI